MPAVHRCRFAGVGDLFESDEEAEEFADYIDQMRQEERARYRD